MNWNPFDEQNLPAEEKNFIALDNDNIPWLCILEKNTLKVQINHFTTKKMYVAGDIDEAVQLKTFKSWAYLPK